VLMGESTLAHRKHGGEAFNTPYGRGRGLRGDCVAVSLRRLFRLL
jgi:hypothetical protein